MIEGVKEEENMDKRFIVIVVVVLAVFGVIVVSSKKSTTSTNGKSTAALSSHTRGAGTKKVTLIEYGDFQCPVCGRYYPTVEQVVEKYGDQVTFQYRNFPLESLHQNARAAHRASEAASLQGKFWEMFNQLYQNQNTWSGSSNPLPIFEAYATDIGLNIQKYKIDYASSAVNDVINADVTAGQALKVTGTPGFILNGKLIENPRNDVVSFSEIIDKAIAEANPASTTATPSPTPVR